MKKACTTCEYGDLGPDCSHCSVCQHFSGWAPLSKVELHKDLCLHLNEIYEKKNHDYGDSFHQTFVEEDMAMARIRLGDKFNRFKTLSKNADQKVADESIRDTLLDLANYAIMTVLEMDIKENDQDD